MLYGVRTVSIAGTPEKHNEPLKFLCVAGNRLLFSHDASLQLKIRLWLSTEWVALCITAL